MRSKSVLDHQGVVYILNNVLKVNPLAVLHIGGYNPSTKTCESRIKGSRTARQRSKKGKKHCTKTKDPKKGLKDQRVLSYVDVLDKSMYRGRNVPVKERKHFHMEFVLSVQFLLARVVNDIVGVYSECL